MAKKKKDGQVLDARKYGYKAWPLWVEKKDNKKK